MKILLVEDDPLAAAVLSEVLTAQYYTVDVATDGQLGLELATSCNFALILLDLLIPELDGISFCQQLRDRGFQKPILLLTAKDSATDVVRGLDAGADDYVVKPYDLSELLARIRALLRRGDTNLAPAVMSWGKLVVNLVSAEVTYAGQKLLLSPKEYSLLGLFLSNPQRVFSRSSIIDRLWSINASPSEGTVTNLIKDLRQKLKAAGLSPDLLETVYGLGYRLKVPPKESVATLPQQSLAKESSLGEKKQNLASINTVLKRYQATFAARVSVLEQVETALRAGDLSQSLQQEATQEAHRLAGALGSFGYQQGSRLARSIEQLLGSPELLNPKTLPQFSRLTADLKQALSQPPTPIVTQPPEQPAPPLVWVITEEEPFIQQLQAEASAWRIQIESIQMEAATDSTALAISAPAAILLNLSLQPAQDGWIELQTLKQQLPAVPILVMTPPENFTEFPQERLRQRVAVSRLGVQRVLHPPIAIAQILEAIAQVLPKPQTAPANVIILDDDPAILEALHNLLQPWGLQVTTLHDPKQLWEVLSEIRPDLLVMDLEMPEFNGIDLCRVVRQDPQWGNLPILVVTAHTDMESIQQVFAAGADDFIGKPVVGPELVTRVISRLDRVRLQQEIETMKRRIGT